MAKPGSAEAAALHGGIDLSALKKPATRPLEGEEARKALDTAEGQGGLRCNGCHRRISEGWHFTNLEPMLMDGKPTVSATTIAGCSGVPDAAAADGCVFSAVMGFGRSLVAEPKIYIWMVGDAPAPPVQENGQPWVPTEEQVAAMKQAVQDGV